MTLERGRPYTHPLRARFEKCRAGRWCVGSVGWCSFLRFFPTRGNKQENIWNPLHAPSHPSLDRNFYREIRRVAQHFVGRVGSRESCPGPYTRSVGSSRPVGGAAA